MPEIIQDKKVFTLFEVANSIRKTLAERYTSAFWIKADMNKLNIYAQSGHCFPELVEKKEGRVIAELKALLWRDDYNRINKEFIEVLHEPLKDGITILFSARIQFDPVFGLNLRITEIDPWYSLGELEKEKHLSISRLQKEGIFEANKKLSFPLLPKRIAIISVESSKGYSDFMKVLKENSWDYNFFYMLFPAFLQGDKAVPSILYQLNRIKKVIAHFDVVAIIRGGGGDIGLTCYNNFELAKAIALYPLPVITGIGHSTNETVSEMVAYKNAITPTELADFLLQRYHEFTVPLQEAENTLIEKTNRLIREQRSSLFNVARYLRSVTKGMISNYKNELAYTSKSLVKNSGNSVSGQVVAINHLRKQVSASTLNLISLNYRILTDKNNKLSDNTRNLFRDYNKEVLNIEKIVNIMSPVHVLNRGYSITTVNGTLLKSISEVKKGDRIVTILTDGSISSTITSSKKSTENEQ